MRQMTPAELARWPATAEGLACAVLAKRAVLQLLTPTQAARLRFQSRVPYGETAVWLPALRRHGALVHPTPPRTGRPARVPVTP